MWAYGVDEMIIRSSVYDKGADRNRHLKWLTNMHTLNRSDAISASWVWRLVFMMRAYWGSGLETQAKGIKPLIEKWVFYTDFQ